jgi:hypothetical protein
MKNASNAEFSFLVALTGFVLGGLGLLKLNAWMTVGYLVGRNYTYVGDDLLTHALVELGLSFVSFGYLFRSWFKASQ